MFFYNIIVKAPSPAKASEDGALISVTQLGTGTSLLTSTQRQLTKGAAGTNILIHHRQ